MNHETKTHYRKAFNSPYLSSADIVGPTDLIIQCVRLEKDKSKKSKDSFNTAYFTQKELRPGEPLKPMILNAGNSKTMSGLCKSAFIDDWQNVPVTVFVDPNVRFGRDTVEGLRLRHCEPAEQASDEQIAIICDYRESGHIKPETEKWLTNHDLTYVSAHRLIESLKAAH